jgi:hypothetical protein
MALERTRLDIRRFCSAENEPDTMACNASGLIRTVSINRITMSSQRPSTLCFGSTVMQ